MGRGMSDRLPTPAWQGLSAMFVRKRDEQAMLRAEHEASHAFGLAYLALWATGEDFAKQLGHTWQRIQLRAELDCWIGFLSGAESECPKDVASAKFKLARSAAGSIPSAQLLQGVLSKQAAPTFYEILDPDQKYRRRRNSIAHSGESVSLTIYDEFKEKALTAQAEIKSWLQSSLAGKQVRASASKQ